MPPLSERIKSYLEELKKWEEAGKPTRSKDRIAEIYDNCCSKCEHLTTTISFTTCDICGCLVNKNMSLNKIFWATTNCPHDPPYWTEEVEQKKIEQTQQIIETKEPQIQLNESAAIINKSSCCG